MSGLGASKRKRNNWGEFYLSKDAGSRERFRFYKKPRKHMLVRGAQDTKGRVAVGLL